LACGDSALWILVLNAWRRHRSLAGLRIPRWCSKKVLIGATKYGVKIAYNTLQ
jgi:hypothetical protein